MDAISIKQNKRTVDLKKESDILLEKFENEKLKNKKEIESILAKISDENNLIV